MRSEIQEIWVKLHEWKYESTSSECVVVYLSKINKYLFSLFIQNKYLLTTLCQILDEDKISGLLEVILLISGETDNKQMNKWLYNVSWE